MDTQFNPMIWIGSNRVYNTSLPDFVIEEKNKLLKIPDDVQKLFPANDTPVKTFLTYKLPRKDNELVRIKTSRCFSKLPPPNPTTVLRLFERPIPSDDALLQLEKAVGQAWLDGAISIVDWRYEENIYLPFWMVPFWRHLSALLLSQEEWRIGEAHFKAHQHLLQPNEVEVIANSLKTLPWNGTIQSPAAYRLFVSYLPARSERSFKEKVSREPRFPLEIGPQTFDLIKLHLQRLRYNGPLALACDDTKLNPSLRIYYNGQEDCNYLVGCASGPMVVPDPESLDAILRQVKGTEATKLRLWVLTIERVRVAPMIVAARPISNNMNASQLFELSKQIFLGLVKEKGCAVSFSADGTDVERDAQARFEAMASSDHRHRYTIANPQPSYHDLTIEIPVIEGQPVVIMQDSKHCLKTLRNNLYTGVTCLVLGNHIAMYQHIADAAKDADSPLYQRDVVEVDRQDDNAATRLFSAQTLEHFLAKHPNYLGDIIYLFVFGELIDAYQNRFINHSERLRMVLRARYFLDRWEAFLDHAQYPKSRYFLSRQAVDILRIIINGFIALMFLHRDHLDSIEPQPAFIPWLHSTEACEHVFGEACRVVKDFTALDFVYMVPKLGMKLRQTIAKAESAKSNTTATGYNHTYLDYEGIDLASLAIFPSDDDIKDIAQAAANDADGLWQLLGVTPAALRRVTQMRATVLPSIHELVYEDPDREGEESDDEELSEVQRVQHMIEAENNPKLSRTRAQENLLEKMTCVSVAVMMDEMTELHKINENAADLEKEGTAEERAVVASQTNALKLAPIQQYDEWETSRALFRPGRFSAAQADLTSLVVLRKAHHTRQAATGTRTRIREPVEDQEEGGRSSLRRGILKKMEASLKQHANQELGAGTGVERQARWMGQVATTGNAANARQVANTVASEALRRRKAVFTRCAVPLSQEVGTARIGARALQKGDYGIVYTEGGLKIGQVLAIFGKGGGKHGRHEAQDQLTNISRASYISVRIFEPSGQRGATAEFRSSTDTLAIFQGQEYAHIPSTQFLLMLSSTPVHNSAGIALLHDDTKAFTTLSNSFSNLKVAMQQLRSRKQEPEEDG